MLELPEPTQAERDAHVASYRPTVIGDRCNCGDDASARGCTPSAGRMPCLRAEYAEGVHENPPCGTGTHAGPCALPGGHRGFHNPRADRSLAEDRPLSWERPN